MPGRVPKMEELRTKVPDPKEIEFMNLPRILAELKATAGTLEKLKKELTEMQTNTPDVMMSMRQNVKEKVALALRQFVDAND